MKELVYEEKQALYEMKKRPLRIVAIGDLSQHYEAKDCYTFSFLSEYGENA